MPRASEKDIDEVLSQSKALAKKYRQLTGKPLGITGEVAEFSAAKLLDLELAEARQSGFDATDKSNGTRFQIKGRCLAKGAKRGQRVGGIKLNHEWDAVLLVILDENFEVLGIWKAGREKVTEALVSPGSRARNERGALSVEKFKAIGSQVWGQ